MSLSVYSKRENKRRNKYSDRGMEAKLNDSYISKKSKRGLF